MSSPDNNDYDQTVDARGLPCPLPLLKTKQALKGMAAGQTLKVLATDRGALRDIPAFAELAGHTLVRQCQREDDLIFYLLKT